MYVSYFFLQSNSENSTSTRLSITQSGMSFFQYSVKVMNPSRKTSFVIKKLKTSQRFQSVEDIKADISDLLSTEVDNVGYIEPGHGNKGKQHQLETSEDLNEMYKVYGKKREVRLWCLGPVGDPGQLQQSSDGSGNRKRSRTPGSVSPAPPKRAACAKKLDAVEEIVAELKKKHGSKYSAEQMSAWAHMIQLEKHASRDNPPDLPYFKKCEKKRATKEQDDLPARPSDESSRHSPVPATVQGLSPCKRIQLRTECINQLDKWHALVEKGGITKQQYDDVQKTILGDIQQ